MILYSRIYKFVGYEGPPLTNTPCFKNLALADPNDYKTSDGVIVNRNTNLFATFFITGVLMWSGQGQYCVSPSVHLWPHALAVIGNLLQKEKLFIPVWEGGVSFRTRFSNSSNLGKGGYTNGYPIKAATLQKNAEGE